MDGYPLLIRNTCVANYLERYVYGPASFPDRPRSGPGVANTTTGDATTGALRTPADEYTSDSAG